MPGRVLDAGHSSVNQIFLEVTVLKDGHVKSIIDKATVQLEGSPTVGGRNVGIGS